MTSLKRPRSPSCAVLASDAPPPRLNALLGDFDEVGRSASEDLAARIGAEADARIASAKDDTEAMEAAKIVQARLAVTADSKEPAKVPSDHDAELHAHIPLRTSPVDPSDLMARPHPKRNREDHTTEESMEVRTPSLQYSAMPIHLRNTSLISPRSDHTSPSGAVDCSARSLCGTRERATTKIITKSSRDRSWS
jgi:hypothetical protein